MKSNLEAKRLYFYIIEPLYIWSLARHYKLYEKSTFKTINYNNSTRSKINKQVLIKCNLIMTSSNPCI